MKTKSLVLYPDSSLFRPAAVVSKFDAKLGELLDFMTTMVKDLNARGLAANQLGKDLQVVVMRNIETGEITEMVNPVLIPQGKLSEKKEGCLSLPGAGEMPVPRYEECSITYQDRDGKVKDWHMLSGELAHTAQHEVDHLRGRLFTWYLGTIYRCWVDRRMHKVGRLTKKLNAIAATEERKAKGEQRASEKFAKEMEDSCAG